MVNIELIYSGDCPNVNVARDNLKRALRSLGLTSKWKEWDRQDPGSPIHAKAFGSPTILVNGLDVGRDEPSEVDCCRLYASESKETFVGAPPYSIIRTAIEEAISLSQKGGTERFWWKKIIATVPAVGAAFIPGISCPACWPAYAGLLSSFGLGFVNYTPYLIPAVSVLVLVALFSLFYKAKKRRGYGPLFLGALAAILIILGRFVFSNTLLLYSGVFLFVVASIWNALPVQERRGCTVGGSG